MKNRPSSKELPGGLEKNPQYCSDIMIQWKFCGHGFCTCESSHVKKNDATLENKDFSQQKTLVHIFKLRICRKIKSILLNARWSYFAGPNLLFLTWVFMITSFFYLFFPWIFSQGGSWTDLVKPKLCHITILFKTLHTSTSHSEEKSGFVWWPIFWSFFTLLQSHWPHYYFSSSAGFIVPQGLGISHPLCL